MQTFDREMHKINHIYCSLSSFSLFGSIAFMWWCWNNNHHHQQEHLLLLLGLLLLLLLLGLLLLLLLLGLLLLLLLLLRLLLLILRLSLPPPQPPQPATTTTTATAAATTTATTATTTSSSWSWPLSLLFSSPLFLGPNLRHDALNVFPFSLNILMKNQPPFSFTFFYFDSSNLWTLIYLFIPPKNSRSETFFFQSKSAGVLLALRCLHMSFSFHHCIFQMLPEDSVFQGPFWGQGWSSNHQKTSETFEIYIHKDQKPKTFHNDGSETWVPSIVATFQTEPWLWEKEYAGVPLALKGNPYESQIPQICWCTLEISHVPEKWCTLKTKVLSNMACLVVYVQFHSISIFATSPFHSRQATRTSLCQALWQNSTLMRTTWWRWAALKEEPFFGCQDAGENWYGWWKKSCTSWYGKYPIIIHYLQGFIHPSRCRISSINSIRWY